MIWPTQWIINGAEQRRVIWVVYSCSSWFFSGSVSNTARPSVALVYGSARLGPRGHIYLISMKSVWSSSVRRRYWPTSPAPLSQRRSSTHDTRSPLTSDCSVASDALNSSSVSPRPSDDDTFCFTSRNVTMSNNRRSIDKVIQAHCRPKVTKYYWMKMPWMLRQVADSFYCLLSLFNVLSVERCCKTKLKTQK